MTFWLEILGAPRSGQAFLAWRVNRPSMLPAKFLFSGLHELGAFIGAWTMQHLYCLRSTGVNQPVHSACDAPLSELNCRWACY